MTTDHAGARPDVNTTDHDLGPTRGRSGLVVAALVFALAVYLTYGILTMEVPGSAATPGPAFFPVIIAVCAYVLAIVLTIQMLRTPEGPDSELLYPGKSRYKTQSDWKSLGTTLLAFLAFTALLVPVGWILSAALLFWLVARAMGSPRPVMDLGIAFVFSCAVQAFFSAGLDLNLPAGVLEGIL
ncbi:tripartite tricarboxylate transporter TctB family protein [Rhodococcus sp. 06-156-3C]|uniref:tripartite tricarboxylate transporter TctB family protein n=1 Tax=Nocardiaceae TaxID=85025 RepID=UPI0005230489|nr:MULTISPECIES: tripartite tricarboxylate transporter TctB family protein [Rhodococcus]OZD08761.1 tripartite tricarboxylate transporter TctB family protein [Rhodococcus sp. 06-156-4C]OZD17338.1 tripartite tricarboxylate transporter TctB family protein [Rhodococcus sp. 06-156-3C]OZD18675.1 tripartite tricarboxylate transporter TctB family protein [Rhodococcus sp. 06-156-4a]OZD25082.1 tripartite tricarboxylate transporter TctB family protein [Rhodococcus sp. 06-156-3b]OZD34241.1 tripartite tric